MDQLFLNFRGMAWTRCKARKPATCWFSNKRINVGDVVYRPIGNGSERMRRLLASEVGILLEPLSHPPSTGEGKPHE